MEIEPPTLSSPESLNAALKQQDYYASDDLLLTIILAYRLQKPVLLEGAPGVGKTSIAAALARAIDTALIRLQCYEGLDAAVSLYDWNYAKQILHVRMAELDGKTRGDVEASIYGEPFLLERPLLQAIRHPGPRPPVLLIDEVDRADEEFEAFLLEVLSEYQVTIPELGIVTAERIPLVILTSNRSRELSDALCRRCFYLWIDLPSAEKEREIVVNRVHGIQESLAGQIVNVMRRVRALDLDKRPGIAETLDWSRALVNMRQQELEAGIVRKTAGCFLKSKEDVRRFHEALNELLA